MDSRDIVVYLLPGDRNADSDERIGCCARLFLEKAGRIYSGSVSVSRPPSGRPFFNEKGLPFFSVSHSGSLWACALSDRRVGFDIQCLSPERNTRAVARRFFHPGEIAFLESNGYADFFSVWAAKESVVKYTGDGISAGFSRFSVVHDSGLLSSVEDLKLRRVDLDPAYAAFVCYDGPGEAVIRIIDHSAC